MNTDAAGFGLALSRRFWEAHASLLYEAAPDIMAKAAVGLAGEGSECLGFDDELSRDHDFGAAFCLWLPASLLQSRLGDVERLMGLLPRRFEDFPVRMNPVARQNRVGPLSIEGFYTQFTGLPRAPEHWKEWRAIPETSLAACVSGQVFADPPGQFSAIREALLAFYPEEIRLKKLAARCMIMAQAGQYNLPRCVQRHDTVAAALATTRFAESALSLIFLLNRRYMPFYKWAWRGVGQLPVLGSLCAEALQRLVACPLEARLELVENLCDAVARHLRTEGLSTHPDSWLWAHGPEIQARITEPELRSLSVMAE